MLLPAAFITIFSLTQVAGDMVSPAARVQAERFITLSKAAEFATLKIRMEVRKQTIKHQINDTEREQINNEIESKLHELLLQASCRYFTVNQFEEFNNFLSKTSGDKLIQMKWNTAVAEFLKYLGKPANTMESQNVTLNQSEMDAFKKIDGSESGLAFGKFQKEVINVSDKSEIYTLITKLFDEAIKHKTENHPATA